MDTHEETPDDDDRNDIYGMGLTGQRLTEGSDNDNHQLDTV
jgi:hypothetical protein